MYDCSGHDATTVCSEVDLCVRVRVSVREPVGVAGVAALGVDVQAGEIVRVGRGFESGNRNRGQYDNVVRDFFV